MNDIIYLFCMSIQHYQAQISRKYRLDMRVSDWGSCVNDELMGEKGEIERGEEAMRADDCGKGGEGREEDFV